MKRAILIGVLFLTSFAQAQRQDMINVFDAFNQSLVDICSKADQASFILPEDVNSAFTWVCGIQPTINRASDLIDGFTSDYGSFFSGGIEDSLGLIASATGYDMSGAVDISELINTTVGAVDGLIESGDFTPSALISTALATANSSAIQNLTAGAPEGSTELERLVSDISSRDVGRIASELTTMQGRSETIMRSARSQDVASEARELAATALARGDEEQLLKRVTTPNPLSLNKGTADQAEDLAFNAVSSRAAIQANVKMFTDYARQQAVSSANITTAIKEQMVQQTLTTQQLSLLAQTMAEQQVKEYEEWRSAYYEELGDTIEEVRGITNKYTMLADYMEAGDEE